MISLFNLAAQAPKGNMLSSLLMMVGVIVLMYFMMIRPQKKQQAKMKETMDSLKVGDQIVTRSGVRGKIVKLDDVAFVLETGDKNTQIEFLRDALMYVVTPVDSHEEVTEEVKDEEQQD